MVGLSHNVHNLIFGAMVPTRDTKISAAKAVLGDCRRRLGYEELVYIWPFHVQLGMNIC